MTLQEFKAWFEGFTENMGDAPTKLQWARIQARVKEIDGADITYPIFVDRYWPPYTWWTCNTSNNTIFNSDLGPSFNSAQAMYALGTSDSKFLEA